VNSFRMRRLKKGRSERPVARAVSAVKLRLRVTMWPKLATWGLMRPVPGLWMQRFVNLFAARHLIGALRFINERIARLVTSSMNIGAAALAVSNRSRCDRRIKASGRMPQK
jgi:hypothetical protein